MKASDAVELGGRLEAFERLCRRHAVAGEEVCRLSVEIEDAKIRIMEAVQAIEQQARVAGTLAAKERT